jgi:hypothetical protein
MARTDMSRQPDTVEGMTARLREVWGDDVRIEVVPCLGGWVVEAHRAPTGKVDARLVPARSDA